MDKNPEMRDSDFQRSASATEFHETEIPAVGQTASADLSQGLLLHVMAAVRIISDDLQWIVQVQKGRVSQKSSGWRSRHFCRSRVGLQLALRRMLGRDGVPADVVRLIRALPEWHQPGWSSSGANYPKGPSDRSLGEVLNLAHPRLAGSLPSEIKNVT